VGNSPCPSRRVTLLFGVVRAVRIAGQTADNFIGANSGGDEGPLKTRTKRHVKKKISEVRKKGALTKNRSCGGGEGGKRESQIAANDALAT